MVKKDDTLKAEEKPQAREVRRSCNLNLAAAYLREKDYKGAVEATTQVGFIAVPYCTISELYVMGGTHLLYS